jgi:hypothetical protein
MNEMNDRALTAVTAALLERAHSLNVLSIALTVLAIAALIALSLLDAGRPALVLALAISVAAGLTETYLALRVAFDSALFRLLAENALDVTALDAAMTTLGLLPAATAGRPLGPRVTGARRLLVAQVAAAAVQLLLVLLGTAVAVIS